MRGWKSQEKDWFAWAGSSLFLFYLLVSVLWFFPWYLLWPLALGALLPQGGMQKGILLFSFAASLKPAIAYFYYVVAAGSDLLAAVGPEWVLTLGTLLLPWAFFLGLALWGRRRRFAEDPLESRPETALDGKRYESSAESLTPALLRWTGCDATPYNSSSRRTSTPARGRYSICLFPS